MQLLTIANNKTTDGLGIGSFTSNITGLIANTTYYIRAYATNSVGTSYGNEINFITYDLNAVIDYDGNYYYTVTIGSQVWMKENLKVTHFRDGSVIPIVADNSTWKMLTSGACCWYSNDINNKNIYGALYNHYAISDTRNLCPSGWHIPTNDEWQTLITYLGGGSIASGKLKEAGFAHWKSPNTGADNSSGFTALPGGARDEYGGFYGLNTATYIWLQDIISGSQACSALEYDDSRVWYSNTYSPVNLGYSIRCIKD